ncbi:alpha/beta hydrolase [Stappia indica]|uniref:Esterase/lipase superfamily enzyme n=1 Tax=Stappia indica TaxID=538381 RepID=A0A285S9W5_9HYPH|nr:alpha/beta hydrolase [Stappia indica]MCC4245896.1 alpha/beta hydrolase [Stappia indica]SOC04440.1 Esterase/lipase superfamily enzyme [Stappia indica]
MTSSASRNGKTASPAAMVLLVAALVLAACAGRPGPGSLLETQADAPGATAHEILIATTRKRDTTRGSLFSGERGGGLDHAVATVSVPPEHKPGAIEWPSIPPGDPAKDFTLRSASYLDDKGFSAELERQLAKRPKGKREVFVFVHGYNTRFPEALYRMTQLKHDSNMPSVPVLFTWASSGDVTGYLYDTNSATIARDSLERTLRALAASSADRINVLAHSMGNWVLTETVRQIRISGKPLPAHKIGLMAMAAPDVDVDVFKAQLRRTGKPERPYVILISRDDRALQASSLLAGGERLGAYGDEEELAKLGAVVVDLTEVKGDDAVNHGKFAQLAQVAPELGQALQSLELQQQSGPTETTLDVVGNTVGNTAKAAVTFPLKILAAPINILSGR